MRPAPAAPPRHRLALAAVLSALALAGCSRDLDLPGVPSGPTLGGFTPSAAYAGQLIRVTASNLEADAAANVVNFANGSARGERFEGTTLLVRVPAGAGDGPVTVENLDGTSAASAGSFDYLGLGEPSRLQVASAAPILHHPRAVLPANSEVAIVSGLYDGIVWPSQPDVVVPDVRTAAVDAVQQSSASHVYSDADPVTGLPRLVVADGPTGALLATQPLDYFPSKIVVRSGQGEVITFHYDEVDMVEKVTSWNLTGLGLRFGPVPYGIEFFFGAADLYNQYVVIAGVTGPDYELALYAYDVSWYPPATPPTAVPIPCNPIYGLACPPPLALDSSGQVPLMGFHWAGDTYYVAAAIEGGDVVAGYGTGLTGVPELMFTTETYDDSPIEAMVEGVTAPIGIATKPAAGLTVAFDLGGAPRWIVDSNGPTRVDTGRTPNGAFLAYVANDGDNDVVLVSLDTGMQVGRVNFDVAPGAQGYAGAAAWVPAASGIDGDLYFPTTAFPGLVRFPVGEGVPEAVSSLPRIAVVAAADDAPTVWFGSVPSPEWPGFPPHLVGLVDLDAGAPSSTVAVPLPDGADPQRLAAHGSVVVAGHGAGLSLVDASAPPATADVTPIPGASAPSFLGLGFTDGGDLWTLVEGDAGAEVQLWSQGAIAAGGLPLASWPVPGLALSAAWLEDGLWVFWEDGSQDAWATLLDAGLGEVRTVPSNGALRSVDAVSPNGRLLVHRELGSTVGFHVRFYRADPALGFPEVRRLVFDDRVTGFTFDSTGERLYVLTQAEDRVVTVD